VATTLLLLAVAAMGVVLGLGYEARRPREAAVFAVVIALPRASPTLTLV